ncbi:MAG: penicillin acylase family protein, partial [Anaerolineae bacterium]|nr:penicillin acylase family protein [Anaerolineae bacterium]
MRLRRLLFVFVAGLLVCGSATSAISYYLYRRPLPQTEGAVGVEGLRETVSIYRDEWGVPHIYAATPEDLFFAQGYVHAQDRWWQMEINRHLGKGQISLILGNNETALTTDKLIRTVGWPHIAEQQWENTSPESKRILRAYAAGINHYITGHSKGDLAMQYTVLGLTGGGFEVVPWQPIDSLAWATVMNWHWDGNLSQEIERARIYGTLDQNLADSYFPESLWETSVIQPEDLPFETAAFSTFNAPPAYPPGVDYSMVNTRLIEGVDLQDPVFMGLQAGPGSTLWAVGGEFSASGLPLLANAPQTIVSIPSQWYEVGLHCIDVTPACPYDGVGFSAPGLPLLMAGHNSSIAWGIASAGIDTQDVYLVKVNEKQQYEYNGEWQNIEVRTETISINDDEPLTWPVYMTKWGPLISEGRMESQYAMALHWPGLQGDWIHMLLHLNRATNWNEFREALQSYGGTPLHFLYADTQNNIGYQLAGTIPVRAANHSGQSPVPGWIDSYAWIGVVPFDYLPGVYNPGWISAASQPAVPPVYSQWLQRELESVFGDEAVYNFIPYWPPTMQAARVIELLAMLTPHHTDTFAQMQADTENKFAAEIISYLLSLDFSEDSELQSYQNWLAEWNFRHDMDSPQAVLIAMW